MKKRFLYKGELMYGCTSVEEDNPQWHVIDRNSPSGGEYTACGLAFDEVEIVSQQHGRKTKSKNTGICTCPECIKTLYDRALTIKEYAPSIWEELK